MNESTIADIRAHSLKEFGDGSSPKECCGVVIVEKGRETYVPCRNISAYPESQFKIHPEDWADAEDRGEVTCIVHSHPFMPPTPSEADLIECEKSELPWLIVNQPVGSIYEFEPSGYKAPLIGRKFVHGVLDCYSLVRDYYRDTLSIDLPDFEREELWWEKSQSLYMDNFKKAGFVEVVDGLSDLRLHDGVIMQISSPVPNHAGVYIGDNVLLHHFMNRLSSRDVFGTSLRRCTICVVRHRELLNA